MPVRGGYYVKYYSSSTVVLELLVVLLLQHLLVLREVLLVLILLVGAVFLSITIQHTWWLMNATLHFVRIPVEEPFKFWD